jgi:hypothetical protein
LVTSRRPFFRKQIGQFFGSNAGRRDLFGRPHALAFAFGGVVATAHGFAEVGSLRALGVDDGVDELPYLYLKRDTDVSILRELLDRPVRVGVVGHGFSFASCSLKKS